ncbi:MAG TPA: ABC transporter-associated protein EcsC [Prolixibacteraceae bacterium]|nr:ABC transporter-associated protein EcsC [Prolixibacteraceae bacterium]
MDQYQQKIHSELVVWQKEMLRRPTFFNWLSKEVQTKVNTWIPEKVHSAITSTIKQMIRGVLFGAAYTSSKPVPGQNLQAREETVRQRIEFYRNTAAVEGGITGAGGILLGLADFPILIGLKLKLLFDIASIYGFNVDDYKERIYLLHIFELAFSSHIHRKKIYLKMVEWDRKRRLLPEDIHQFDWRNFQQEYRDYIDLAKMAQMVPVIGAPVGAVVNFRLIEKLGLTAMNAFRMRLLPK